jgi:3-dehydroquinate dehydratase II
MKILVLNGPNLNMLGKREAVIYGNLSLETIKKLLSEEFTSVSFVFFQSNLDGELITEIQNAASKFDGIIINPGGYAHTSVALHDALEECKLPKIEVHLSHLGKREEFRQKLLTASACDGYISGFKEYSYMAAVYLLLKLIKT